MSNKETLENIKKLREITGVGFKDCKLALDETNGDIEKSVEFLRKKGIAKASKKMQKDWGRQITGYMNSRDSLRAIILIMDIRHPFQKTDLDFLAWCRQYELPVQLLLNKADKLSRNKGLNILYASKKELGDLEMLNDPLLFSAKTHDGVDQLSKYILSWVESA